MKRHLIYFACIICFALHAQESTIAYTYDEGGKLVQRKIQVMQSGRIGHFDTPKDSLIPALKVFPNPANSYLNIDGSLPETIEQGTISLLNENGQILKKDIYLGVFKTIPVSDLKPGLYLLEIQYSKKKKDTYKIIITN